MGLEAQGFQSIKRVSEAFYILRLSHRVGVLSAAHLTAHHKAGPLCIQAGGSGGDRALRDHQTLTRDHSVCLHLPGPWYGVRKTLSA